MTALACLNSTTVAAGTQARIRMCGGGQLEIGGRHSTIVRIYRFMAGANLQWRRTLQEFENYDVIRYFHVKYLRFVAHA